MFLDYYYVILVLPALLLAMWAQGRVSSTYAKYGRVRSARRIPAQEAARQILLDNGYIKSFELVDNGTQGIIRITLKYNADKSHAIQGLRRVSKPGLRIYAGRENLPKVLKGLGIAIVSTSKGVMTDKEARKLNVGGEVLAFVW